MVKAVTRTFLVLTVAAAIAACKRGGGPEFEQLKRDIQAHASALADLKNTGLVQEGPSGFIIGTEKLNLDQRQVVQNENILRERLFGFLAKAHGKKTEEIAASFTRLATSARK